MGYLDRDDVAGAQAREIASLRAEVEALRKRVEKAERAHADAVAVLRDVLSTPTAYGAPVRGALDDALLVRADAVLAGQVAPCECERYRAALTWVERHAHLGDPPNTDADSVRLMARALRAAAEAEEAAGEDAGG